MSGNDCTSQVPDGMIAANVIDYFKSGRSMNDTKDSVRNTTPCPGCGGSGQTAFFAGESRFMLTREDCPDCAGTGVLLPKSEETQKGTSDEGEP